MSCNENLKFTYAWHTCARQYVVSFAGVIFSIAVLATWLIKSRPTPLHRLAQGNLRKQSARAARIRIIQFRYHAEEPRCQPKRGSLHFAQAGRLLRWNHDPEQQVDQNPWYSAGNERNDHTQPEPECTDTEKLGQSATNTCQHSVTA